jgi:glucoside 3-dehydrogenase (cytochrome c) hitch-hiker subunit
MPDAIDDINRREALRRTVLLLGGVLSAPTIAGFLAGCDTPRADGAWRPRALSGEQSDLVAAIAEHILPETDTPGARSAGVHRFIDTMLAEYYGDAERAHFVSGLSDVEARARRSGAKSFVDASKDQQLAILTALDREAYSSGVAPHHFFRTMKELTLLGYYTSEMGATKELQYNPAPGRFEGCVPMSRIGRASAV